MKIINIIGKTNNGDLIVSGVFNFYSTTGLPLDVIFELLLSKKMIPCWPVFVLEAVENGMKVNHILSLLQYNISDCYGSEYANVVLNRMKKLCGKQNEH